jgi:SOS-response transcriptional repressor LexA
MLGNGHFRAFEIIGDSMLPTPSGSIIVGQKIDDLEEVKQNAAYIVLSRNEGIVYKRVSRNPKAKNKLTLTSDNPAFQPYNINADDVLEIWQAQIVITKVAQQQRWDVGQLANLVSNLQEQVSSLKKRMN